MSTTTRDNSQAMLPFLDRHLIYPLLEFLQHIEAYPERELLQAKYDLLESTNMTDFSADLYKQLHRDSEVPSSFAERRKQVVSELHDLEQSAQKVLAVLENPEVASSLRQDKSQNLVFLQENHGVTVDQINVLYKLGQFQYNCGNYAGAADLLYHFRVLSTDQSLITSSTWGKFAAEILTTNWEAALEEMHKLRDLIDSQNHDNAAMQLKARTWLLHWSLFPLHNAPNIQSTELIDVFMMPAYLNTLQTSAPHLIRYLAVAVLTVPKDSPNAANKRIRDLVRIIESEPKYSDSITKFILALYSKFDFDAAKKHLEEAKETLESDFFLCSRVDSVVEAGKAAMTETYCRLHKSLSIS